MCELFDDFETDDEFETDDLETGPIWTDYLQTNVLETDDFNKPEEAYVPEIVAPMIDIINPDIVRLVVVVEYILQHKQFHFPIAPFVPNHLQVLTLQGTSRYSSKLLTLYSKNFQFILYSVTGITALADINADIILTQPDNLSELVTHKLRNIRLYDNDNYELPRMGTIGIDKWCYDQHTYDFSADHDFQIVVVRLEKLQEVINSFVERMLHLRPALNARYARNTSSTPLFF